MTNVPPREPVEVRTATGAEERRVVDTLVLAFGSDPVVRWFYPVPHDYLRHFPAFVGAYGSGAFDHGTAFYLPEFAAAALWLPPGVHPDDDRLVELFRNSLPEERLEHVWAVGDRLDTYRPAEPFWYLPAIGVDPTRRRRGYGSVLLEHVLETCDEAGTIAYLESSNPSNVSLYVRHGFEVLGTIREGTMPPLVPMLRTPRD